MELVPDVHIAWFQLYLTQQKQKTLLLLVDGEVSDFWTLTCEIPQGSILGPLLFTLYINDFLLSQLFSRPRMYANNNTLTSTAEDADTTCT